jgi:intracellular sulfur oxidation DsrE/DsrF family protein
MDIHAVELLVKDAEDVLLEGFDSHKTYLSILKENNIGVYACPSCLEVAGYSPDDLVDGVETANKNAFFDFTEGRIITLDY